MSFVSFFVLGNAPEYHSRICRTVYLLDTATQIYAVVVEIRKRSVGAERTQTTPLE